MFQYGADYDALVTTNRQTGCVDRADLLVDIKGTSALSVGDITG